MGKLRRSAAENGDLGGYSTVRAQSLALCRPLAVEDYGVQPILDASPPKWHLAHTTWFFETFLLKAFVPGYKPFHADFEVLFNSYYEGVGEQFPRPLRGTLSRPTVAEVMEYRAHVDQEMARLLDADDPEVQDRIELGLHHEQQHQELLLTDLKVNLGLNPLKPAYREGGIAGADGAENPIGFVGFPGGVTEVGAHFGDGFRFDNECPRHRVYLDDFALADRLVTNAEYAAFIADAGYETPSLWLSEGWAWRRENDVRSPMYWRLDDVWHEYRLDGERPLVAAVPVTHVSYYEADAYARWAGARLATEMEWEAAAAGQPLQGNFADGGLHPEAATRALSRGARGARPSQERALSGGARGARPSQERAGLAQVFGDCWEWTSSAYGPYPGFRPLGGTLGEYNGKFMSSQMVLRGGSCATPVGHIRLSYRNFFYPKDRWQFTGIRLARDQD